MGSNDDIRKDQRPTPAVVSAATEAKKAACRSQFTLVGKIPAEYRELWDSEGWDLFERSDDGLLEIQRDDAQKKFDFDDDALRHVIVHASLGSKAHLLALFLDGKPADIYRASLAFIPPELLPEDKWTVVGYYEDNDQPWMEWVEGVGDPMKAAVKAVQMRETSPHDVVVTEVVRGHIKGTLLNEQTLRGDTILAQYAPEDES